MSGESLFHVPYTILNICSRFKLLFSRALVCHWILMILNIITYNEDDLHIDDFELTYMLIPLGLCMSSHIACKSNEDDLRIAQQLEDVYQVSSLDDFELWCYMHS